MGFKSERVIHEIHLQNPEEVISDLLLTNDDKWIITVGTAPGLLDCIRLWDFKKKKLSFTFERAHDGNISGLTLSNDNMLLISRSSTTFKIWDLSHSRCALTIHKAHRGHILSLALMSDNRFMITGSMDKTIKV